MRRWLIFVAGAALSAQSPKYGIGRAPTPSELRGWNTSISPEGEGLPDEQGTAFEAREIYANRCAKCHGDKGQGRDSVALAGGRGSLASAKPLRTVGSYWPYATTVWDYVNRAMPFDRPGTLTSSQVYSLTAYILYVNGIVKENEVMDAHTLPRIQMPNRKGFVADPRPDVPLRGEGLRH